jgi:CPA2 family monovalent cation:H+ antiporter-2
MNTPHGKVVLSILIFQDIIVVPMMLITPLMAGGDVNIAQEIIVLLLKVTGVIVVLLLLARYLVPFILKRVVMTRSRELFLLTIIVFCFATAWLTASIGLSLALGAFFAGLIISESPYSHQATANILPFREIFLSFFFVSVGMLLDIKFFLDHVYMIHLLALASMVLKFGIASLASMVLRYPLRSSYLSGLALAQVGEFAFLLSIVGLGNNILSQETYQYFLAISIISMGATPVVIHFSGAVADFLVRWPLSQRVLKRLDAYNRARGRGFERFEDYHDHLVIIGCGLNGQNLSKAAKVSKIPYLVAELDPEIFARARAEGEPVIFGDASSPEILKHLHTDTARIIVVAISDIEATRRIVLSVRQLNETAFLIVRTRSIKEIEEIMALGADDVIPEEFETSVKIFTKVLEKYLVPEENISKFAEQVRSDHYEIFRNSENARLPETGR